MDERARDLRRLLTSFVGLGVGNYGALAASLAINAVLTRRLGTAAFGHLAILLMASQVVSLVSANWTQLAVVRFGAVEYAASQSIGVAVWTRVWIAAPWAAGATLLIFLGRAELAAYLGAPQWVLAVVVAHFTSSFLVTTVGAAFQARNEMRRYGTVLFLDKAMMAVVLLVAPSAWASTPERVLTTYAFSSLVAAAAGLVMLGWRMVWPVRVDRRMHREMLAFSLPLILSSWAGLIGGSWFDVFVLKHYQPVSAVGLYQLGVTMAGVVQQITVVFSTLLLPQMSVLVANGDAEKIRTFVDRLLPYWFLLLSVLLCVVIVVAGGVVPFVFTDAFRASVPVLVWLALATCALALFNAFQPFVVASGSTWTLTGICLLSGAVNVILDFALIPTFGVSGSAFATVVSYAVSAGLVLRYAQRRLGARVVALSWLALPVAILSVGYFALSPILFYVVAIPGGVVSVWWLVNRFRLFRAEDAVYLQGLRLPASLLGRTP